MRMILIAAGVLVGLSVQPSQAAQRAWCIEGGSYGRGSLDCTYYNLQQCRASASGAGGYCIQNPALAFDRRPAPPPRRVPRQGY